MDLLLATCSIGGFTGYLTAAMLAFVLTMCARTLRQLLQVGQPTAYDLGYQHGYDAGHEQGWDDCLASEGETTVPNVPEEQLRFSL